jgi:hypothetical protein
MEGSPGSGARARSAGASRGPSVVLLLGLLGAVLLAAAEFATIASVEIPGRTCREIADVAAVDRCSLSGFERHGGAFLLLAVFSAFMAWGAGRGGSRPAAIALLVVGVVVLALSLLRDLPETERTGAVGITYEGASAKPGVGFGLEVAAGALLAGAGGLALRRRG